MEPRGRVQRWDFTGVPKLFYRCRTAEGAWDWTADIDKSHVFPSFCVKGASAEDDADAHAIALKKAGVECSAVVVSAHERARRDREQVNEGRLEDPTLPPDEVYRRTLARMGEHEEHEV